MGIKISESPIKTLYLKIKSDTEIFDYYTGPFAEYEKYLVDQVFWDIEPTRLIVGHKSCNILEIGCGDGRICEYLARDGHKVIGIDRSINAISAFKKKIESDNNGFLAKCEAHQMDVFNENVRTLISKTDSILISNISVNLFSEKKLRRMFCQMKDSARYGTKLYVSCLSPDGVNKFKKYDSTAIGSLHFVPYSDVNGRTKIMNVWLEFDSSNKILFGQWLVDLGCYRSYENRYAFSILNHRIWSSDEVRALMMECGLTSYVLEKRGVINVGGLSGCDLDFVVGCF
ncbi:class I SAM-dependent methyltransferase [Thalassospira alkalitolerans]|uniref:class I SAM-dependent methyltransferase n=1 Tax=Thalassospira alkalitolerans TaxID=1293890 RepID=UPI003AA9C41B